MTVHAGYNVGVERQRKGVEREFNQHFRGDADLDTFVETYTEMSKKNNWEQMSLSTAQGAALLESAYGVPVFDGRYIYYCPNSADTFLRFDTKGVFTDAASWARYSKSTAQGASGENVDYLDTVFDGRYVYFLSHQGDTSLRFDTTQAFSTAAAWERASVTSYQGSAPLNGAYRGACFDGRYIYVAPSAGVTFMRYDTTLAFGNPASWGKMSVTTAAGAWEFNLYQGCVFDGRYVYYIPRNGETCTRFDTQGTSFQTAGDWENINVSTILGGSTTKTFVYGGFDGRYVYYSPFTSQTFLRYDNTKPFTEIASWETIGKSTVGGSNLTSSTDGCVFDGRYIYFSPRDWDTLVKFDTFKKDFSDENNWSEVWMSTVQGSIAIADHILGGGAYDGKYVYFSVYDMDTFVRGLALPK